MSFLNRLVGLSIISLAGASISHTIGDWTWFAGSGSVMVAGSIWFFAASWNAESLSQTFDFFNKHVPADEIPEKLKTEGTLQARIDRMLDAKTTYEAAVLGATVGTLIWGFGDLIGRLI